MIWWILWLCLALALLGMEFMTADLVSIWFSAAALVCCVVTAIFPGLHWAWQVLIFAALSIGLLFATRPFVRKFLKKDRAQATNLELIVNGTAMVVEDIDNDLGQGAVKLNGLIWSARSEHGGKIPQGTLVLVQSMDGNKLIVKEKNQEEN